MTAPEGSRSLPLLSLRNLVLFPGAVMPVVFADATPPTLLGHTHRHRNRRQDYAVLRQTDAQDQGPALSAGVVAEDRQSYSTGFHQTLRYLSDTVVSRRSASGEAFGSRLDRHERAGTRRPGMEKVHR